MQKLYEGKAEEQKETRQEILEKKRFWQLPVNLFQGYFQLFD